MTDRKFPIKIGTKLIEDLMNPRPGELDYHAITTRLKGTYRFSGAKGALNVHQHRHLVCRLVEMDKKGGFEDSEDSFQLWNQCCEWAFHHDDHEGITGDIVAPVKNLISSRTNILEIIETKLDWAICTHLGINHPNKVIRGLVHRYDKAAETIEWVHALGNAMQDFNHSCPEWMMDKGTALITWARSQ